MFLWMYLTTLCGNLSDIMLRQKLTRCVWLMEYVTAKVFYVEVDLPNAKADASEYNEKDVLTCLAGTAKCRSFEVQRFTYHYIYGYLFILCGTVYCVQTKYNDLDHVKAVDNEIIRIISINFKITEKINSFYKAIFFRMT